MRIASRGAWDKLKGNVKEGVGKLTGDEKLQAEGSARPSQGRCEEHRRWR